jgi:hypothetical protein
MDMQFWIWLIIIVVTLIARANKKKPQTFDQERTQNPSAPTQESKPVSFEDLLREIQASKAPKPVLKQVPVAPKQDFEDYDDNLEEENKSLERAAPYSEDRTYETYENAKKAAFSRASLEETMHIEDTEIKFGKFGEYSKVETKSVASQYAEELRSPQSFKRALILSEILNKRF